MREKDTYRNCTCHRKFVFNCKSLLRCNSELSMGSLDRHHYRTFYWIPGIFPEHESMKNIIIWPGHGDRPVGRSVVVWFWCVYGDVRFIIIIMCNFASTRTRLSDKIKTSQLQYPVQRWSRVKSSNKFSARNGLFAIVHPIQEKNV